MENTDWLFGGQDRRNRNRDQVTEGLGQSYTKLLYQTKSFYVLVKLWNIMYWELLFGSMFEGLTSVNHTTDEQLSGIVVSTQFSPSTRPSPCL